MIYKPPANIANRDPNKRYIFLGGSIENGTAVDWQIEMTNFFNPLGIGVFNPRRDDWDSSLPQTYKNPSFNQQVNWELNALDRADRILMCFIPETISPISLMELGRYSTSGRMAVVCPDGYWRKGNVEAICVKDDVALFNTIDEYKHYAGYLIKNNLF